MFFYCLGKTKGDSVKESPRCLLRIYKLFIPSKFFQNKYLIQVLYKNKNHLVDFQ